MNYSNYALNFNTRTMNQICNVEKMEYQKHQQFCRKWFENNNKKMLLFHGLGSGKTLTSIYIAEGLLKNKSIERVYAVTPASLKKNFEKELTTGLMSNVYNNVPKQYTVLSYQKFIKMFEQGELNLQKALVIIDEVQNIVSDTGSVYKKFFHTLVTDSPNQVRVVLLSGTPMFDKPHEIAMTLNLLNLPKPFNVLNFYKDYMKKDDIINEEKFMKRVYPYVSGFKGISPKAYAKRKDVIVNSPLRKYQKAGYEIAVSASNANNNGLSKAFLSGPRMAANLIYHNGGIGKKYFYGAKRREILLPKNVKNYSSKFHECLKRLKKTKNQAFIYSNFVESGGINDFITAMKLHDFDKYSYGVFKTNEDEKNNRLVQKFNNGKIQFIIGSPAMKEGISLKNCREVHLLDPYWNLSRVNQVIGRAIRFCSHVSLPKNERTVTVYHYLATIEKDKTVDQHIVQMSQQKAKVISKFENLLYRASADCNLFYPSTGVNVLDCFKSTSINNVTKLQGFFSVVLKNGVYVSVDSKKEERLSEIIQAQGMNKAEDVMAFNINLYTSNKGGFEFSKPDLNRYIRKVIHHKSPKNEVKLQIKIMKRVKKNNKNKVKKGQKALKFKNKQRVKYTIAKPGKTEKVKKCTHDPEPDGKCPDKFPFKKNDCCFLTPGKYSKGIIKGGNKVYVDGKYTKTMSLSELTKVAFSYRKKLQPKMKRQNIIRILGQSN